MEGLEMFGMGNWEQISEHIGTKSKLEIAQHYERVYVQSDQWPVPVKFSIFI
jgi:transcriptional adapter 2-alpha